MEFDFQLATEKDDADLRHLLATNAMPGQVTVAFEREPNYFLGCGTMGQFCQVIVAHRRTSGDIAGVMCRSSQPRFINGQVQEIGYLGQLRVAEKYRGRWVLTRGLPFLRQLHADGRIKAYYAVISDENVTAKGVLVDHPRRYFPALRKAADIHTLGIILRQAKKSLAPPYTIRRGSLERLSEIVAFLRQYGADRQFFPAYTEDDFGSSPATRGFELEDFVIAQQGDQIVGVMGLWDQSNYKQSVARAYAPSLRRLRPFYNLGAWLVGAQPLPGVGEHINSAYASFICIAEDNLDVFRALLRQVYNLAAERGYAHLMLGLFKQDPLLSAAQAYAHISYHSSLYTVCWDDAGDFHERLDGRTPYIEIAAL